MCKKIISVILVMAVICSCFTMAVNARKVGVGGGAESFNPVEFSQEADVVGVTTVSTNFVAKITDANYKVKINSISAFLPFLEDGDDSSLFVSYEAGTVVENTVKFPVTGHISENTNSVARYTVSYDILDRDGNTVWKNLTGYAYGKVSGSEAVTGAIGTDPEMPGQVHSGAYFTSLDKLNSCYVQVSSAALLYTLKTQHLFFTFNERTTETQVIEGNAPATFRTYPVDWPSVMWWRQEREGTWLMWSTPESDYYSFTLDMNANDASWDEETNTIVSTEMYYLDDWDRTNAKTIADRILALNGTFEDGQFVQKGKYTEESWNNLIEALDIAEQVMLSVPGANYGFKIACQNGVKADNNLITAFENLQEAECDWTTYKDPIAGEQSTCGSGGTLIYTCICGKTKIETTGTSACIPSDEWVTTIEPTCTTKGEEAQLCTMCSNPVNTRELAALGHEYTSEVVPPTCLEQGYTIHSCIRGDHTYNDTYVDATGHTPGRVENRYPSALSDGLKTIHCRDCDIVIGTERIEKPDGNFVFTLESDDNTFFTSETLSDLTTTLTVPKNLKLNTEGVLASLALRNIGSFDLTDEITYRKPFTSEDGNVIELDDYLPLLESATISGTLSNKDSSAQITTQDYKYNLTSENTDESYVVNIAPESETNEFEVYKSFVSHISSEKMKVTWIEDENGELQPIVKNTNYIQFPGTAYVQIGTEKLSFENDKEVYTFSETADKPQFLLEEVAEIEGVQIELYIPAGTVIAVGNLKLTFVDYATIRISGFEESETINSILSVVNSCTSNDEIIENLAYFFIDFASGCNEKDITLDVFFTPAGYIVTGTLISFDSPYDDTALGTVELLQDGERKYITSVSGAGEQEFKFDSVADGTYQVRILKMDHIDRMYELTVDGNVASGHYKIHLFGDINGDGKTNTVDVARANAHARKITLLDEYEQRCADVNVDERVNTIDVAILNAHARNVSSLW